MIGSNKMDKMWQVDKPGSGTLEHLTKVPKAPCHSFRGLLNECIRMHCHDPKKDKMVKTEPNMKCFIIIFLFIAFFWWNNEKLP